MWIRLGSRNCWPLTQRTGEAEGEADAGPPPGTSGKSGIGGLADEPGVDANGVGATGPGDGDMDGEGTGLTLEAGAGTATGAGEGE